MKKKIIFIISIGICVCSCSCKLNTTSKHDANMFSVANIVIKQGENYNEYYSKSYLKDNEKFYKLSDKGEISRSIENKFFLSEESKEMIEKDGGMLNVLKVCLSAENYNKLDRIIFLTYKVTMSLDGALITGYYFSIFNKNIKEIQLKDTELDNLFNYLAKIKFIYEGEKYRNKIVPIGYTFSLKKD